MTTIRRAHKEMKKLTIAATAIALTISASVSANEKGFNFDTYSAAYNHKSIQLAAKCEVLDSKLQLGSHDQYEIQAVAEASMEIETGSNELVEYRLAYSAMRNCFSGKLDTLNQVYKDPVVMRQAYDNAKCKELIK